MIVGGQSIFPDHKKCKGYFGATPTQAHMRREERNGETELKHTPFPAYSIMYTLIKYL